MSIARPEELSLLFTDARTYSGWTGEPVDDALLRRLHDLWKMGPTSGNSQPLRVVFVKTAAARERLLPAIFPLNVEKVTTAPVTAIVAHDVAFHEKLPQLVPVRPEMKDALAKLPPEARHQKALQSATLQAGYLILAARALGLDCGPMAGFDAAKIDAAFFPDGAWRSSLLVNLGHGDPTRLHPRLPRLSFDEACRIE